MGTQEQDSLQKQKNESDLKCESNSYDIINNFSLFFFEVFGVGVKRVEGKFDYSDHLVLWCKIIQSCPRTLLESARFHLKTTISLGYLAWRIYRMREEIVTPYSEWLFLAYREDLAAYQLKRLKRYIDYLPEYFGDFERLTIAETYVHMGWKKKQFIIEPEGILAFKRGRHPDGVIADDILKDPQARLDISQLKKVEQAFLEEIEPMPKHELHVFGTPQDKEDLFAKLKQMESYKCFQFPAIKSESKKEVLWESKFSFERLQQIRKDIGDKAFNKEYMCRPVRQEEAFLKADKIEAISKLKKNFPVIGAEPYKFRDYCYGGLDIGKKSHPSHLFVMGVDRKKRLAQVHSKWMDGWDYKDQIEYCRQAIRVFNIERIYFDNTRAEFEGFMENETLPDEMKPLVMGSKVQWEMASALDAIITQNRLLLLNEGRQKRQLLAVDNDLKAAANSEGHGDCFWSLCMAVKAFTKGENPLVWEV